jgi:hypothetical protein
MKQKPTHVDHINGGAILQLREKEGKAIPVIGRAGPYICETSRLPHFLDNRLTDGGEVVSLMRRPPFTPLPPREIPGFQFC